MPLLIISKSTYAVALPPPLFPRVSNAYASVETTSPLPNTYVRTYFMDDSKDIHPCVIDISLIKIYKEIR